VVYREYSRECGPTDVPYYPIRLVREQEQLGRYVARARAARGVTFLGRLGTYRYLDMDTTIHEALGLVDVILGALGDGGALPAFAVDPLA
jgi:UDP-galactopyranose mutase